MQPRVIWVERTGFQNAFDMFRNEPSSEHFKCSWVYNVNVWFSLPANVKSPWSPSAGSVRAAASFRLSTARRADRTDHLATPHRRSVVRLRSHCVAKPLAQLIGRGRTWIDISDVNVIPLQPNAISLLVTTLHNNSFEDCFLCRIISAPVPASPGIPRVQSPD